MKEKLWEAVILVILTCLAARLVLDLIVPILPALIALGIVFAVGNSFIKRKGRW